VTGATIHLVDSEYDHGRAIACRLVDIDPSDAVEDIERKVMKVECDLIIETVRRVSCGDLKLPL
jgi:phosphoribosylglycinamide formyltransferase-1